MRITVVGAGLAGAVAARLLVDAGHQVEVFESRENVGGNCFDEWDRGVLVQRFGPHCFHTDKAEVWEFVNRFATFRDPNFCVVANTQLGVIPIPFNDVSAERVGELSPEEIRDLLFVDYSEKHWGIPWAEIPSSITGRVPKRREGRDCRYHLDRWQGIPTEGFTRMFETMLEGIPVHLGCGEDDWRGAKADHVVFTGSLDDYFRRALGTLEYRSLEFEYATEAKREHFQINECNRVNPWTRAVDHSHWLDQDVEWTVIGREYPCEWDGKNVRMYPKPFGGNPERFRRYWEAAKAEQDVTFVGRLATYKYLDMDDVVAQVMLRLGEGKYPMIDKE
ncbi:UDP-galactopyranose mutase [Haloferula luteola]|uniref:UDP-galactopyranose mutase n=1 Tax=Haloferula luteola TaxID=595692 RepID=A0A840V7L7_9BACT|nr:UDP-galactopyranose mutase [Haloferula luteola]MBB5353713.1 UDP-galactopyranose mutase [Haloferula luteola]